MTRVRSICVDVETADGGATVVLRPEGAVLRATCSTCGSVRTCPHVEAALAALAEASSGDGAGAGPASSSSQMLAGARTLAPSGGPAGRRYDPLLTELHFLIEALLRAATGEVTASVDDALRAASRSLSIHPLPGVARVLGRVSASLGGRSALETALAVTALSEVAAALEGARGDDALAEVAGSGVEVARLDDMDLVEVSRVRDRGTLVWESRLLVDTVTGTLVREEGAIGGRNLMSAGTCGRRLAVSLASREASLDPPRVRLLQYTLEPAAPRDALARIAELASPDVVVPPPLVAAPLLGVACPRPVWLAPAAVVLERHRCEVVGKDGQLLAIDRTRDPGAMELLGELLDAGAKVLALAGACQVGIGGVRITPQSVAIERGGAIELVPLAA